jgi:hypothetical protein
VAKPRKSPAPEKPRLAINGRRLSIAQERDWRRANDDLATGDFWRVQRGVRTLRALESALRADETAASVRQGLADTIALERGRGETVEVIAGADVAGRVRIRSRDGLETLQRSGGIDPVQFRAGMLYRDLYEAADPERDLRSQMRDLDRFGAGRASAAAPEAWQERRLRRADAMAAVEDKVRCADRDGCALRTLREIAGHARCISHMSAGGGGQAAHRRALCMALDVVAAHFGVR